MHVSSPMTARGSLVVDEKMLELWNVKRVFEVLAGMEARWAHSNASSIGKDRKFAYIHHVSWHHCLIVQSTVHDNSPSSYLFLIILKQL